MQKKTQIFVQEAVKVMESLYEKNGGGVAEESTLNNSSEANREEERIELTIKEFQEFSEVVQKQLIEKYLPEIVT